MATVRLLQLYFVRFFLILSSCLSRRIRVFLVIFNFHLIRGSILGCDDISSSRLTVVTLNSYLTLAMAWRHPAVILGASQSAGHCHVIDFLPMRCGYYDVTSLPCLRLVKYITWRHERKQNIGYLFTNPLWDLYPWRHMRQPMRRRLGKTTGKNQPITVRRCDTWHHGVFDRKRRCSLQSSETKDGEKRYECKTKLIIWYLTKKKK